MAAKVFYPLYLLGSLTLLFGVRWIFNQLLNLNCAKVLKKCAESNESDDESESGASIGSDNEEEAVSSAALSQLSFGIVSDLFVLFFFPKKNIKKLNKSNEILGWRRWRWRKKIKRESGKKNEIISENVKQ